MRDVDREILRLAVPAFGALAAEPLYVLADTAIVGHLGTPQLGGLAVASTLILSGYSIFVFLAYGTTGTVARLLGAGHRDRAAAQAVQAIWLALFIGIGLALVGLALTSPLVHAMGSHGDVARYARSYFHISMIGVPAVTLTLAGTGYLRGLQDTRTPLAVALTTNVVNLVLEVALVYGLHLGVAGSAWATVVVQLGAAAVYVTVVGRDVRANGVPVRPDRGALIALTRVSIDLFVRTIALRGAFLAATAKATHLGTVSLAAHDIGFEVLSFLALALDSVAIAAQALVGHRLGASDAAGARASSERVVWWGWWLGVAFAVALLATRPWLPHVFTSDHRVLPLAAMVLAWVAIMEPVNGIVFALDGVLIGAGDVRFLAWAMGGVAVLLVASLPFVSTLAWLWFALSLFQCGRLVALVGRWRSPAWLVEGVRG